MRRVALLLALLALSGTATAQSLESSTFITLEDPALTVSMTTVAQPDQFCNIVAWNPWSNPPPSALCIGGDTGYFHPLHPRSIGVDAAGATYGITGMMYVGQFIRTAYLYRSDLSGPETRIATLDMRACANEGCTDIYRIVGTIPVVDPVAGTLTFLVDAEFCPALSCVGPRRAVKVLIGGLPKMFDTLLTFIPGGEVAALMPAHPDGFRSAERVQVWTGDVRSMPDWSQAQSLTCDAATNPAPGQVVTVADTLPDPPVGHGRYYLTATVNGLDRRLGRQHLNGAFSARSPGALPVCQ